MNTKQIVLTTGLVAAAIGVLSSGVYWYWLSTPPTMPQTAQEALAVLASPRYQRLPEERREAYIEQSRKLFESLSPEERRAMMEQTRDDDDRAQALGRVQEDFMYARAKAYFEAGPEEKVKKLDQAIAMMESGGGWRGGPGGGPPGAGGGGDGQKEQTPEQRKEQMTKHMQDRIEKGNPQKQEYMAQYMKDLRDRRKAQGLSPDPPRGMRHGGGGSGAGPSPSPSPSPSRGAAPAPAQNESK